MGGNWTAPNPPFGAVFTYNVAAPLPAAAKLVLTITDDTGRQIRRLDVDRSVGFVGRPGTCGSIPPPTLLPHLLRERPVQRQLRPAAATPSHWPHQGATAPRSAPSSATPSPHLATRRPSRSCRWSNRAGRDSGLGTRDLGFGIGIGTRDRGSGSGVRDSGLPRRSSTCTTRTEAVPGHAEAPDAQPERRRVASAFRRKIRRRRRPRQSGHRPRDRRCEDPPPPGRLQSVQSPGPAAIAAGSPAWRRSDLAV